MISNPDLVHYTCIARQLATDSTILAEFNLADSFLQKLAQQCLHFTPPHHTIFSQTFSNQTFTFLLDYPFVYFGIFDQKMIKFDQINLLQSLRDTLNHIIKGNPNQKFTSFCLQDEIHPIFQKLLSKSFDFDSFGDNVANDKNINPSSVSGSKAKKMMALPMLSSNKITKCLKKKRWVSSDSKEALVDGKSDVLEGNFDVGEVKSREVVCQNGVCFIDGHGNVGKHKAKKIWRRHVWVVLVLDLCVCLILFGIWLFVCKGFQCIDG
ncbi:hypothetical protein RND81_12G100000 [Saponaria officinalis]|uniref:Uncharacterized protein n=1 Tax=Saponaria officinalis TaxID=3572 RepID=A0AAW1H8P6_SAPOF